MARHAHALCGSRPVDVTAQALPQGSFVTVELHEPELLLEYIVDASAEDEALDAGLTLAREYVAGALH